MTAATATLTLFCEPGSVICPRCFRLLLRQHTGAGWRFEHCDRKLPQGTSSDGKVRIVRCNTHLFISRGRGDPYVMVAAIDSEADKQRLIEALERAERAAAESAA